MKNRFNALSGALFPMTVFWLTAFLGAPARRGPTAPFPLVVKNGAMTQGGAIPDDWGGKFGDVDVARDTQVYQSAPASLRVSISGGKNGSAFQSFQGGAGATFKIAGWFKTGGQRPGAGHGAGVRGRLQAEPVHSGAVSCRATSDWTHFEKEVTLPPWTAFFNVGVMAEGDGQAWLDEVHEASAPVDAGQALTDDSA